MLVRDVMPCYGSPVSAVNHSMNVVTCWVIPIASDFVCIMFHASEGDRNGGTISGCTMERGDRYAQGTETLSGLGVSSDSLGCPGARRANDTYVSASLGTSNFLGVSQSGRKMTVSGNWPRRMYCAKARIFPFSGVGLANDGVTK